MKIKIILSSLTAFIMLISSCSKKITSDEIHLSNKAEEVKQLGSVSLEAQKTAFSMLASEDKVALWQTHLKNCLENDRFTIAQKDVIKEYLKVLTPNFFENKKELAKTEYAILQHRASKLFTKEEARLIFSSLLKLDNTFNSNHKASTAEQIATCECSQSSDYCSGQQKCLGSYYCLVSESGCGTFWAWSCNGDCFALP